jgi:hypothetical protein
MELIKEESTSELLRFTMCHILNQNQSQPESLVLKEEQHQKQVQINQQQQQLHSQATLQLTTSSTQQCQVPNNIIRRNNLGIQKTTS